MVQASHKSQTMSHFLNIFILHFLLLLLLVVIDRNVLSPDTLTGTDQRHRPPQSDLALHTQCPPVSGGRHSHLHPQYQYALSQNGGK